VASAGPDAGPDAGPELDGEAVTPGVAPVPVDVSVQPATASASRPSASTAFGERTGKLITPPADDPACLPIRYPDQPDRKPAISNGKVSTRWSPGPGAILM
jgi:hypothetical protein